MSVRIHDTESSKRILEIRSEAGASVKALAFHPDGSKLVVATSTSGTEPIHAARVWDSTSGRPVGPPLTHQAAIADVAFSPDGRKVVTASEDHTAQMWDAETGRPAGPSMLHNQQVKSARFAPDGRTLATQDHDGLVHNWDAVTGRRVGVATHAALLPTNRARFTGATHTALWREARPALPLVAEMRLRRTDKRRPGERVFLSPDRSKALKANDQGWGRLVDVATGLPRGAPLRHPWGIGDVAFSPDGKKVVVGSHDKPSFLGGSTASLCQIVDTATGQPLWTLPHLNWVRGLAYSPDGKQVVSGDFNGFVHFWDAETGKESAQPLRQPSIILGLALSPDGRTLAVQHSYQGATSEGVLLWDVKSRTRKGPPLPGASGNMYQFSPDSKWLAIMILNVGCRLWDTTTGQPTGVFIPADDAGRGQVLFSRDSGTLLTASEKGTVRLWETATGRPIGKPMLHATSVGAMAFSPDAEGKYILIGCADGIFRLWDRATCRPLGPPVSHHGSNCQGEFSPDGRSFITSASDGSVRVWPVPSTPPDDAPDRLRLRLEVRTGLTLEGGETIEHLLAEEWEARRKRLAELEGSEQNAQVGYLDDRAWHEQQARDAEQECDAFAARWHLDRLIELDKASRGRKPPQKGLAIPPGAFAPGSPDWRLFARRARAKRLSDVSSRRSATMRWP